MSTAIAAVTDATFTTDVLGSDMPVLVDFWAPWCGPCRQVAPVLEALAQTYTGRLKVVKVDTDANPATAAAASISSVPTINIYRGGQLVQQVIGAQPRPTLVAAIEAALA